MKTKLLLFTLILFTCTVFNSCKKDADDTVTATENPVLTPDCKITGTVKTPSGQVIGSARVSAGPYETLSDKNGDFVLEVYHGNYTLKIHTGQGNIFNTSLNVSVNAGAVLAITPAQSVLSQVGALAYVPGVYDQIESIVTALGYTTTAITVSDLSNATLLSGYDALFFNCGALSSEDMDSAKYVTLGDFLQNGGSIYASDYAVEMLTGDGNWRLAQSHNEGSHRDHNTPSTLSTCVTPMLGGFIADTSLCTLKSGSSGLITGATIVDPFIINLLGQSTIDIDYDLGAWEVISLHDTPFHALITDANYGPLAVKSDQFGEDGGIIFFTTFHNHPQGAISSDVSDILEYFILNL